MSFARFFIGRVEIGHNLIRLPGDDLSKYRKIGHYLYRLPDFILIVSKSGIN